MDYKKAYNEALERAKSFQEKYGGDYAGYIFPELREGEDERILRNLIDAFTEYKKSGGVDFHGIEINALLAWLEKQKEPVVNGTGLYYYDGEKFTYCGCPATEENPYDFAMSQQEKQKEQKHPNGCFTCDEYKKGYEAGRSNGFTAGYNKAMKEQKPVAWGEEDEEMLNSCISSIEEAKENRYAYKETDGDTSYDHEIAWLKSLRNRVGKEFLQPHWKPSEEQMKALLKVVDKARELHYSSNSGYDEYDVLRSLYKQLEQIG